MQKVSITWRPDWASVNCQKDHDYLFPYPPTTATYRLTTMRIATSRGTWEVRSSRRMHSTRWFNKDGIPIMHPRTMKSCRKDRPILATSVKTRTRGTGRGIIETTEMPRKKRRRNVAWATRPPSIPDGRAASNSNRTITFGRWTCDLKSCFSENKQSPYDFCRKRHFVAEVDHSEEDATIVSEPLVSNIDRLYVNLVYDELNWMIVRSLNSFDCRNRKAGIDKKIEKKLDDSVRVYEPLVEWHVR